MGTGLPGLDSLKILSLCFRVILGVDGRILGTAQLVALDAAFLGKWTPSPRLPRCQRKQVRAAVCQV